MLPSVLPYKIRRDDSGKLAPSKLEREMGATDEEIADFVYELYDITAEKRKIIKGLR